MIKCIRDARRRRRSTAIVTLDIERAFDTVWHHGLIFKLVNLGFPHYLCKILKSFLESRRFFVQVGNKSSHTYDIVAGTPQGSLLSPILFSIYTSDIPTPRNCVIG